VTTGPRASLAPADLGRVASAQLAALSQSVRLGAALVDLTGTLGSAGQPELAYLLDSAYTQVVAALSQVTDLVAGPDHDWRALQSALEGA
jgi:hypothetical protein